MTMRQRKYIRPQTKVRTLHFTLLNDISVPGAGWDDAKQNVITDYEIQSGVDELNLMFE